MSKKLVEFMTNLIFKIGLVVNCIKFSVKSRNILCRFATIFSQNIQSLKLIYKFIDS